MRMMKIVGLLSTQQEAIELNIILNFVLIGKRSRVLGKEARKRMLKGDFSNKPMKKQNKTAPLEKCVICGIYPRRNETAKTCDQRCAGKLAWETRGE